MATPTSTSMPEETDRAKETLAAEAAAIVIAIGETIQSIIIHLKKMKR